MYDPIADVKRRPTKADLGEPGALALSSVRVYLRNCGGRSEVKGQDDLASPVRVLAVERPVPGRKAAVPHQVGRVDNLYAQVPLERHRFQILVDHQETTKDANLLLRRHAPKGIMGTANLETNLEMGRAREAFLELIPVLMKVGS